MNVRAIGIYEIVFCDNDYKRIQEVILDCSLHEAKKLAKDYMNNNLMYDNYYISKVVDNSIFNVWKPKK